MRCVVFLREIKQFLCNSDFTEAEENYSTELKRVSPHSAQNGALCSFTSQNLNPGSGCSLPDSLGDAQEERESLLGAILPSARETLLPKARPPPTPRKVRPPLTEPGRAPSPSGWARSCIPSPAKGSLFPGGPREAPLSPASAVLQVRRPQRLQGLSRARPGR